MACRVFILSGALFINMCRQAKKRFQVGSDLEKFTKIK